MVFPILSFEILDSSDTCLDGGHNVGENA